MENKKIIPTRGYLLHITHYDPWWLKFKAYESPFNLELGLEIIDEIAKVGLNLLVIDVKDGVMYKTHPELKRHYSHDIGILKTLSSRAAEHGIETTVKLNFSQSSINQHNHWFRPHNYQEFDKPEYFERAFQIIDELIEVVLPKRFFHIGMDEDHDRSHKQYVNAIKILYNGLKERNLRTIIWNDSCCDYPMGLVHQEKSMMAEDFLPKDIIQVMWDYRNKYLQYFDRIKNKGFETWGAPGGVPEEVEAMRDKLLSIGGTGMLMTHWIPCVFKNKEKLIERIRTCGLSYSIDN